MSNGNKKVEMPTDAGVNALKRNLQFDRKLQEKDKMFKTVQAEKNFQLEKRFLNKIKYLLLAIYYFVTPFFQAPAWCIKCYREVNNFQVVYYCATACGGVDLSSRLPKFSPTVTCSLDILCLTYFAFSMWFRTTWREVSSGHRKRFYLLIAVAAVSITDLIVSLIL